MIGLGVIGFGHWGPQHIRVFSSIKDCRVVVACDLRADRRRAAREAHPGVRVVATPDELLADPEVQAVVIASHTDTHFELAKKSLERDKDVLCEKPLAVRPEECEELLALAEKRGRVLMVGHVYLFNRGIIQMRDYIKAGRLGMIRYAYSVRSNRGPVRKDVNVVYDLASHDISVFNYLFDARPTHVEVKGIRVLDPAIEDAAFILLTYPGPVIVNVHVSWLAARKVRQITVMGDARMMEWDELSDQGPVTLIEKPPSHDLSYKDFGEFQLLAREAELSVPWISTGEPLEAQARHFLECVRERSTPLCDGVRGAEVVQTLWEVQQKLTGG